VLSKVKAPERKLHEEWFLQTFYARFCILLRMVWLAVLRRIPRSWMKKFERWCIYLSVLHSLREHIGILRATKHLRVDLGLALELSPDGGLVPCKLTYGRSQGIQTLTATYPWASLVDCQLFLLGFDTGAEWMRRNLGSELSRNA
jgi:hypothetical protein